jgi:hypothetical protein
LLEAQLLGRCADLSGACLAARSDRGARCYLATAFYRSLRWSTTVNGAPAVAIYAPYLDFPDEAWLKRALMYWDAVERIVPRGLECTAPEGLDSAVFRARAIRNIAATPDEQDRAERRSLERIDTAERAGELDVLELALDSGQPHRDCRLHPDKVSHAFIRELSSRARMGGEWVETGSLPATVFMSELAAAVSKRGGGKPVLSDSVGGPVLVAHAANPQTDRAAEFSVQLVGRVFDVPVPKTVEEIEWGDLLAFRDRTRRQRQRFRSGIDGAMRCAVPVGEMERGLNEYRDEVDNEFGEPASVKLLRICDQYLRPALEAAEGVVDPSDPSGIIGFGLGLLEPTADAVSRAWHRRVLRRHWAYYAICTARFLADSGTTTERLNLRLS